MQINITLSKKEKRHYFLYLLGMLFFTVLMISVVVLSRYESPFADSDLHSVSILQEKTKFDDMQKSVQKQSDSVFAKLEKFEPEKASPIEDNDIRSGITDVNSAFMLTNATDTRKASYPQIAEFYKMFYEDKKNAETIKENTKLFTKQFEDCTVGYRNNRQEMTQRENALLMRGGR